MDARNESCRRLIAALDPLYLFSGQVEFQSLKNRILSVIFGKMEEEQMR